MIKASIDVTVANLELLSALRACSKARSNCLLNESAIDTKIMNGGVKDVKENLSGTGNDKTRTTENQKSYGVQF